MTGRDHPAARGLVGRQGGEKVVGYLGEEGIDATSKTGTATAIRPQIDNRRWAGVPFSCAPASGSAAASPRSRW